MDKKVIADQVDPVVDQRGYRNCLSQFGTGVTVMTAQAGSERAGVTVNSFASLSLQPPLVTWAIKRDSRSVDVFKEAGNFAVNILADDQIEVSRAFAMPGLDKFSNVRWKPGADGAPLVENVLATMECETEFIQEGGDHFLIVGRVKRFSRFERLPLLFVQGRYGVAVDHPELKPMPEGGGAAQVADDTTLMVLALYAYQAMSHRFDTRRKLVGMSQAQSRVLAVLQQNPGGLVTEPLAALTYLGTRDAEDVLADLRDRGLVQQNGEKFVLTQAGFGAREAILRHLRDFDAEQMSPFTPEEVQAARRVAANKAYEQAGVGPGDVNVAEVHDATAFAEILHVENLGFCQPGEGGRMAETGETRLGGRLPVNPSGGLVSKGHPIAATGAMQIHELVTQLRGEAGARQVPNARIAAAENGGGFFGAEEAATVVTLLGR